MASLWFPTMGRSTRDARLTLRNSGFAEGGLTFMMGKMTFLNFGYLDTQEMSMNSSFTMPLPAHGLQEWSLPIEGMTCASCVAR